MAKKVATQKEQSIQLSNINMATARPSEIELVIQNTISQVVEGERSASEVAAWMTPYKTIIEKVEKDERYKSLLQEELEKYGKDGVTHGNVRLELGSTSRKDYSHDEEYNRLEAELKARKEFLDGIPSGGTTTYNEDGEEVMVYPPSKKVSPVIKRKIV